MSEISDVSEVVSKEKYYLPGENYEALAARVSLFISAAEKDITVMEYWRSEFYRIIGQKKFIPGGRILANAGTYFDALSPIQKTYLKKYIESYDPQNKRCGQMLNCYVIELRDSKHGKSGIYESIEDAADITAMEGGVGENFSRIRPKGIPIRGNPNYKASGPISFLKIFNASSKQLRQGGGRRGANMAVLNCDHPDIEEFIDCKRTEGELTEYNISVGIYDSFMEAVEKDSDWDLKFDGKVMKTVKARQLFKKICHNIHADGGGGEPGFIFLDTARKTWPFSHESPDTTNPCGEQILGYNEACDLGAMNLYAFFKNGKFDVEDFKNSIHVAIRFLDNVLDLNNYPLKYRNDACRDISMRHRRIGLGIMGLADVLMASGIGYGTKESIAWIDSHMSIFANAASEASKCIGREKGVFIDNGLAEKKFQDRRNCCVTTIAPTGTTSMVAGVWGGCEPFFGLVTKKKTTDGTDHIYYMVPDAFRKLFESRGIKLGDSELKEIYENSGSVKGLAWVPDDLQRACVTSMDISADEHVAIQCVLQKYVENSISKTINLNKNADIEEVENAIFNLWRGGAKGGTIYRDGSRNFQIMNVGGSEKQSITTSTTVVNNAFRGDILESRPPSLSGKTYKMVANLTHQPENIYITVNHDELDRPVELFVHTSHELHMTKFMEFLLHNNVSYDIAQMITSKMAQLSRENIGVATRLISLCLRHEVPISTIIKQLRKINITDLNSFHKKMSKVLSNYIEKDIEIDVCANVINGKLCGGKLMYQEGCLRCDTCFMSKCD
jgi:ribonucleoside-diphosphate reductase alpha chain